MSSRRVIVSIHFHYLSVHMQCRMLAALAQLECIMSSSIRTAVIILDCENVPMCIWRWLSLVCAAFLFVDLHSNFIIIVWPRWHRPKCRIAIKTKGQRGDKLRVFLPLSLALICRRSAPQNREECELRSRCTRSDSLSLAERELSTLCPLCMKCTLTLSLYVIGVARAPTKLLQAAHSHHSRLGRKERCLRAETQLQLYACCQTHSPFICQPISMLL